jgi:hypothetical protein
VVPTLHQRINTSHLLLIKEFMEVETKMMGLEWVKVTMAGEHTATHQHNSKTHVLSLALDPTRGTPIDGKKTSKGLLIEVSIESWDLSMRATTMEVKFQSWARGNVYRRPFMQKKFNNLNDGFRGGYRGRGRNTRPTGGQFHRPPPSADGERSESGITTNQTTFCKAVVVTPAISMAEHLSGCTANEFSVAAAATESALKATKKSTSLFRCDINGDMADTFKELLCIHYKKVTHKK